MTLDLFAPAHAMSPAERKKFEAEHAPKKKPRGLHAALPGSGPAGETCGSCRHLYRRKFANVYLKCYLMQEHWSNGGATDIRKRDPACAKWEKPT